MNNFVTRVVAIEVAGGGKLPPGRGLQGGPWVRSKTKNGCLWDILEIFYAFLRKNEWKHFPLVFFENHYKSQERPRYQPLNHYKSQERPRDQPFFVLLLRGGGGA